MNSDKTTFRGKEIKDRNIYAYRLAVLTGMRPGELRYLRWSDIQNGYIYIHGSINIYGEKTTGKNKNAIRRFKVFPMAKNVLDEYKKLFPPGHDTSPVFELDGPKGFLSQWYRYCDANNIPRITLYEMRHTFVSMSKRLPEGLIKPLVGHSQDMDTFGVYGHEVSGDDDELVVELQGVFEKVFNYGKAQLNPTVS